MPILKPRQVPAAIKRGLLRDNNPGGRVLCSDCGAEKGATETPFWSEKSRIVCDCRGGKGVRTELGQRWHIAEPHFGDVVLDLRGE